jgi:single-strand DNA-binding protein
VEDHATRKETHGVNGIEMTLVGNMVTDVEMNPNGTVGRFRVAVNRVTTGRDGQRNEKTAFITCKTFGQTATNLAASLRRGMRVIVVGNLQQEDWESRDGEKRSTLTLYVDDAGPSARWATISGVEKTSGGNGAGNGSSNGSGGYNGGGRSNGARPQAPADGGFGEPAGDGFGGDSAFGDDPFAVAAPAGGDTGNGGYF